MSTQADQGVKDRTQRDRGDGGGTTHFVRAGEDHHTVAFAICGERIPNPVRATDRVVGGINLVPGTNTVCGRCEAIALEWDFMDWDKA